MLWPRSLSHDRRGMIVVVAIPMAAILVGCLWQLASVGDAVLYRERLQDVADATAFESAVLHARGMNAVAMLNIVMALLFALSSLIRAVELLAVVGLVFFGSSDPLLSAAGRADAHVSDRIAGAVTIVSTLQEGVAAATPVLASVSAAADNTAFYRGQQAVSGSLPLSYALLPSASDRVLALDPEHSWLLSGARASGTAPRLGSLFEQGEGGAALPSLPVEQDSRAAPCVLANHWAADNVRALLFEVTRDPSLTQHARQLADRLAAPPANESTTRSGVPTRPRPSLCTGLARSLPSGSRSAAADRCSEMFAKTAAADSAGSNPTPARIWSAAANGNVMLQTWAIALSDGPPRKQQDERGMSLLAAASRSVEIHADPSAMAQSEYYYACAVGQSQWPRCADSALWTLGWTARLRRLRRPDGIGQREPIAHAFVSSTGLLRRGLRDLSASGRPALEPQGYVAQFFAATPDTVAGWVH